MKNIENSKKNSFLKRIFIKLSRKLGFEIIDQKTKELIKYLLVGQRVWQLAFTPDQKTLITTNGVSNDVSIIDVEKLKVKKSDWSVFCRISLSNF